MSVARTIVWPGKDMGLLAEKPLPVKCSCLGQPAGGSAQQASPAALPFPSRGGGLRISRQCRARGTVPHQAPVFISGATGGHRIVEALLEEVQLKSRAENTKCLQWTALNCLKVQIPTGFRFSLPALLKQKVKPCCA